MLEWCEFAEAYAAHLRKRCAELEAQIENEQVEYEARTERAAELLRSVGVAQFDDWNEQCDAWLKAAGFEEGK